MISKIQQHQNSIEKIGESIEEQIKIEEDETKSSSESAPEEDIYPPHTDKDGESTRVSSALTIDDKEEENEEKESNDVEKKRDEERPWFKLRKWLSFNKSFD